MKTRDCTGLCASSTKRCRRLPLALITLLALCATSCRSLTGLSREHRSDSLQSVRRTVHTLLPVPPDMAVLRMPEASLTELPPGAGYSARDGRAAVSVRRTEDGDIEVTATCDSLARRVIVVEEELTRIRSETAAEEKPPATVREPSGWQWFQIWTGRMAVACLVLIWIVRRLKRI